MPFVDMKIKDAPCDPGEDNIFERPWSGIEKGCVMNEDSIAGLKVVSRTYWEENIKCQVGTNRGGGMKDRDNCYGDRLECVETKSWPSSDMDVFGGTYFCGFRGGEVFVNAARVDPETKKCAEGRLPCSSKTSPENTICRPPTDS